MALGSGTLRNLVVKITADTAGLEKGLDKAVNKLEQTANRIGQVGKAMTFGLTVPIVGFTTASIKMASDLDETRNKTKVVFGKMGEDVLAWGKTTSKAYGLAEQTSLNYASTFGSLLKNMNLTEEQTLEYSKALTGLAADYASFHNLEPGEAFEKIKAGLVGSSEPLLSLGKDLRQTAVEAYALANGLDISTQSGLALARIGSLMAQSKDEIGDYARTADGFANTMRGLKEAWAEFMAGFGEGLDQELATFVNNTILPFVRGLNEMDDAQKQQIRSWALWIAAAGPSLFVLSKLIKGFIALKASLAAGGAINTAIIAIAGALGVSTSAVWVLIGAIAVLIGTLIKFGPQAWNTVKMLWEIAKAIVDRVVRTIWNALPTFYKVGYYIIYSIIEGFLSGVPDLFKAITNPIKNLAPYIRSLLGMKSPSKLFMDIGENIMLGLAVGIDKNAEQPKKSISNAMKSVTNVSNSKSGKVDVTIYGDMSPEMMQKLRAEVKQIFTYGIEEMMGA